MNITFCMRHGQDEHSQQHNWLKKHKGRVLVKTSSSCTGTGHVITATQGLNGKHKYCFSYNINSLSEYQRWHQRQSIILPSTSRYIYQNKLTNNLHRILSKILLTRFASLCAAPDTVWRPLVGAPSGRRKRRWKKRSGRKRRRRNSKRRRKIKWNTLIKN